MGISVATNLLNNHIKTHLSSVLTLAEIQQVFKSTGTISLLEPFVQERVKMIFAEGYNKGTGAILGFTIAQFLSVLLMWEKKPRRIP